MLWLQVIDSGGCRIDILVGEEAAVEQFGAVDNQLGVASEIGTGTKGYIPHCLVIKIHLENMNRLFVACFGFAVGGNENSLLPHPFTFCYPTDNQQLCVDIKAMGINNFSRRNSSYGRCFLCRQSRFGGCTSRIPPCIAAEKY